ncbi:MAG: Rad52/Rad22 family DNA repair protein [Clostridia bacterium]|nr:Rad52/Rad22 family DNA repair protein [Clostridia bacterium]
MGIHEQLLTPFPAEEIEWRVQSCGITNNKPWVKVLAYVEARAIQNRLDEVFGWDGWTEEYRNVGDNMICRLGVLTEKGWIYKENGASNTDIEAFKGGISGAFKRVAASGYGIGRYLYNLEESYAECQLEKPSNTKGWETAKTKEKDPSQKKTIYWKIPTLPKWALPSSGNANTPKEENLPKTGNADDKDILKCFDCSKKISVAEHDYSVSKYKKPLCMTCQSKVKQAV